MFSNGLFPVEGYSGLKIWIPYCLVIFTVQIYWIRRIFFQVNSVFCDVWTYRKTWIMCSSKILGLLLLYVGFYLVIFLILIKIFLLNYDITTNPDWKDRKRNMVFMNFCMFGQLYNVIFTYGELFKFVHYKILLEWELCQPESRCIVIWIYSTIRLNLKSK